jgi:hypothetical protein
MISKFMTSPKSLQATSSLYDNHLRGRRSGVQAICDLRCPGSLRGRARGSAPFLATLRQDAAMHRRTGLMIRLLVLYLIL